MDNLDQEIIKGMHKESLRYFTDDKPGYFRQKYRNHFRYYDDNGNRILGEKKLQRINGLVIPPAWRNVWIAPLKNAHLQATGIDEKGRKQYIYHPSWNKLTQENKFSKMIDFGLALPKIRSKIRYDLSLDGMDKRKIVATIVWLLEHTFLRVGNEEYQKENNSYGLTTLRNKHATVRGNGVTLRFVGKHGVENIVEISHKHIAKTIKKCIELPGYELFQYINAAGERRVVDSEDVNNFLKEVTGDDFTAKDFRTWGATHLASETFFKIGESNDKKSLKKNISDTVKTVAAHLNNTANVCRNYYIHPTIIDTYTNRVLIPHFMNHKGKAPNIKGLSWDEEAVLTLLKKY